MGAAVSAPQLNAVLIWREFALKFVSIFICSGSARKHNVREQRLLTTLAQRLCFERILLGAVLQWRAL
jgi:hypothetical protein